MNAEKFEHFVLSNIEDKYEKALLGNFNINIDRNSKKLTSCIVGKVFQNNIFNKRIIAQFGNFVTTLPYGFSQQLYEEIKASYS